MRRVILDAGSKAMSAERLTTRTDGFDLVRGAPELVVSGDEVVDGWSIGTAGPGG